MSTSVTAVVAEGLADVGRALDPRLADRLAAVCARAGDPPTVAVAGRVSAGKSTLVNALVGRRVAPTDAGECTQVVARFRYGRDEHVVVHTVDGGTVPLPLDDHGRIPTPLGLPIHSVAHLEVRLANRRLRRVELVDTPGVSSGSAASGRAEAFLGLDAASRHEVARADAVIYLLTPTGRSDEAADLAAFGAGAGGRSDAAIGVLGKADLVGGGDPSAVADLVHRLDRELAGSLKAVLPLWTLVSESVACGRFREPDAAAVAAIAALEPGERELLLADASLFVEHRVAVDRHARRHLQDLLGHHGAVRAVRLAAEGVTGAARLADALDDLSGRSALEAALDTVAERADVLRAARMLTDAEKLGYDDWTTGEPIRDAVERLRTSPALHVLEETAVLEDLGSGRIRVAPEISERALAALGDPGAVRAVDEAIDGWREIEVLSGDPAVARIARTVIRTLALAREEDR